MNGRAAQALEIRIGDLVEHESERCVLREIERLLADDGRPAIVFANFEIGSRQIDLLVALDGLALVIEAKGFTRPVCGGENGPWRVHLSSGHWKDFRNPYRQALDAALEVKNAAGDFARTDPPYIDAAVVFAPEIPSGSQAFPGNRKVSVIGQDGLGTELGKRTRGAWSVDRWREFADHLGLTRASSVCAACDPGLVEAEDRLRRYAAMFCRTYGDGETLVPFSCESNGVAAPSSEVMGAVLEGRGGALLHGPSGCGKTMLASSSGVALTGRGGVAISVQGKDFVGGLKELMDREASLLGARSGMQLINDARRLGRPILFIVDGYNECSQDRQRLLTRVVAALAYRYEAGILVTSQVPLARGSLLELQKFEVRAPITETKVAIAMQAGDGRGPSEAIEFLLGAVSTGLEAKLVGEVGATVAPGSSCYALFDAYARKRLGEEASDGIRVLSQVSAWLFERFAFSLSVRDFDRLMDGSGVSTELRRLVIDRDLLTLRGDRMSFPHEMFLDAFAAEAVIRQAGGSPGSVLKALAAPLHAGRKDLVIGAIDDDSMLERLLPRLEDHASIRACLQGRCGSHAREWAEEHCRRLWVRLREEVCNVRFRMEGEDPGYVDFEEFSLAQWNRCDRAFLGVFPERIAGGVHLEDALDIVGILDRRLAEESLRLREETGMGRGKLRSELFEIAYVHPQRRSGAPGMSTICAQLNSGAFMARRGRFGGPDEAEAAGIRRGLAGRELSPGQIYLFLMLARGDGIPASFISRTIEAHWDSAPNHLRLSLMDAAAMRCVVEDEAERAKLIEKIEGVLDGCHPWFASIVMEALKRLGALDDSAEGHRKVVLERIGKCLARPTDSECQDEAWGIYSAQFDHPYSDAYYEEVAGLADRERKKLLEMASRGAKESAFFLGPLLLELASFGDRDVGESVGRWTNPPPADNRTMPQSDIHVFVAAHIALGRLGCPLPVHRTAGETPPERALKACGTILYWCNRIDLDEEGRREACAPAVTVLMQHGNGAALDVLRECEDVWRDGWDLLPGDEPVVRSVVGLFPAEATAISRDALSEPTSQVGYFRTWSRFDIERILAFGIRVLESYGNRSDRSLLRQYAATQEFGGQAIAALRAIEERLSTLSDSAA